MGDRADAVVTVMEGKGFYNANSSLQAAGIAPLIPLWERTLRSIDVGSGPIVIADYASSEGRNSMVPIKIAIRELRAIAGSDRQVEVVHTDLPSNDFSSLFTTLENDPESYLTGTTGVYSSAVGRSYFDAILPPGRVNAGWNSWSLHWLSRNPMDAPDHVAPSLSSDPAVLAAMAAQQAEDLRRFLMARASELRSDGRLLSVSLGRTIDRLGWVWLMGELWEAVCDMVRDGLLSEDEQLRINFPFAQRSVAEVQEPFSGTGEFAGLSLEHVEVIAPPDPFWQAYQASGDSGALGESWARTLRAINAPMTRDALKSRSDCDALVEDLFIRFGQRIAANPQRNECYGLAVVLRKI